jgi:hypothetical protein
MDQIEEAADAAKEAKKLHERRVDYPKDLGKKAVSTPLGKAYLIG